MSDTTGGIGGPDDRAGYAIGRLAGGALLDSTSVVADRHSGEIRFYDRRDSLVGSFGRKGSGPGEFRAPVNLVAYDDSTVAVWDTQLSRLTLVRVTGVVASVSPDLSPALALFPDLVGVLATGEFVFRDDLNIMGMSHVATGIRRDSARYFVVAHDGSAQQSFALAGDHIWFVNEEGARTAHPVIFGSQTLEAVSGDRLYIVTTAPAVATIYHNAPDTGADTIVRMVPCVSGSVASAADAQAVRAEMVSQVEARLGFLERRPVVTGPGAPNPNIWARFAERIPSADSVPAVDAIRGDGSGGLWVRRYSLPSDSTTRWLHLDSDFHAVGEVEITRHLDVLAFLDSHALLASRDSLDRHAVLRRNLEPYMTAPRCNSR